MIGVFDSGVGGLSIWRELATHLPTTPMLYLADQAHLPYGERSLSEVRQLTLACVRWMLSQGCQTIVVACNTASAAALDSLRDTFPSVPFVGVEPAIKPAAQLTHNRVIGVLATTATLSSERFHKLAQRWANGVHVITRPCPNWVQLVEEGLCAPDLIQQVSDCLRPLLAEDADVLVLACTHFSFLRPWIEDALRQLAPGQTVTVIDPAQAVARQALRVHVASSLSSIVPMRQFWTTADPESLALLATRLLGHHVHARQTPC